MNDETVDYETVEAEVQRLIDALYGAPPAAVQAESDRLRRLAERVRDERGRERALFRAGQLPRLVAGPSTGSSEQFQQAQVLFGQAVGGEGPAEARIAEVERALEQLGELAEQAPAREGRAIRRMTSPLLALLDTLQRSGR